MAFLAYSAFDFAADARGYAWGGAVEYYHDDWAFRVARVTPPKHPNQLEIDFQLHKHYGDQVEIEHNHELFGQPGAVRILGYRNREVMGRFDEALEAFATNDSRNAAACTSFNYGSANDRAPDLCWVRRPNYKVGLGLNVEQRVTPYLGLFARGMYSDGRTEVYSYVSADRSLSFGALAQGAPWGRPRDLLGVGNSVGWISRAHARYLRAGGIDGFIGDGGLTRGTERVLEAFYSVSIYGPSWLTADLQHISNPAYNIDRGPVNVVSGRFHAEF
ncbi:MAG: carbohydrate porin [Polyangiaceae bacterium]